MNEEEITKDTFKDATFEVKVDIEEEKEIYCSYTDEIICPHCGYEYTDSWEYNDSGGRTFDCRDCGKEFTLEVNIEVTYSTEKP